MRIAIGVFATLCLYTSLACAQTSEDSSSRALDSAYHARKAQLDAWVHAERSAAHPQQDFLSAYLGYGGYLQLLPKDLNEYFSQRALVPNPLNNRNNYSTIDRAFIIGGQAQLANSWGVYFEYDLTMKWFNITIDSISPGYNIQGSDEELDLTEHSFVVGGMYIFYSGPWYRLRASGGIGGVVALTSETETGGYSRSASATGYQINFDILNELRVDHGLCFTIDLLTRTVTTGTLKTSADQTLDAPLGKGNPSRITLKPTASSQLYGLAAGLVFYF